MTMQRQLTIASEPIEEAALRASRQTPPGSGAVVQFLGVVRDTEAGQVIAALEYETFQRMAAHQFHRLLDDLEQRWPIASVRLVHRTGQIHVGEASFWVEVVAPHRAEAFAACQWLIDEMKRVVPIWKKPVKRDA
jgi:molybdopterin synthase catalytic subunit